jgi:hypothetical protein
MARPELPGADRRAQKTLEDEPAVETPLRAGERSHDTTISEGLRSDG